MDVLRVNNRSHTQSKTRRSSKDVKVVYISSPMKVKTSAAKFKALVQELTGRDSDAERYIETNIDGDHHHHLHQNLNSKFSREQQLMKTVDDRDLDHVFPHHKIPFSNSNCEFSKFSDSLFKPFTGHFELDVLGSFDHI